MTEKMIILIFAAIAVVLFVACVALLVLLGKRVAKAKGDAGVDATTEGLNFAGFQNEAAQLNLCEYAVVSAKLKNWPQILETFGGDDAQNVLKYLYQSFKANLSTAEPAARVSGGSFCLLIKNREIAFVRTRIERITEAVNRFNGTRKIPYIFDMRYGVYMPKRNDEDLLTMCEISAQLADSAQR